MTLINHIETKANKLARESRDGKQVGGVQEPFFLTKSFNGFKKNRRARRKGHVVTSGCELEQIILNSRRLVLIAAHEEFLLKKNLVQKIVLNINS